MSETIKQAYDRLSALQFDPVLIKLIRRLIPQQIAYDICGVQPMTGPTGLIFAMKPAILPKTIKEAYDNLESF